MDSKSYSLGRVEGFAKGRIHGWAIDSSAEKTLVDLYVGEFLIASSHTKGERHDIMSYIAQNDIPLTKPDVLYSLDPADCPFSVVDDVLALLEKSIAEGTSFKDTISVRFRETGTALPFVNGISNDILEDLRQLIFSSVRQLSESDPLWAACTSMRMALEKSGLWCGAALTDEEMDIHRDDPVGLCVDAAFMDMPSVADGEDTALEYYRTESHFHPIRPNALFDDQWYVRHHRSAHRTVASGLCRSGLDHYLHEGLSDGDLPACWMHGAELDVDGNVMATLASTGELGPWVSEALVSDPAFDLKSKAFVAGLADPRRSGVAYAKTARRHAANLWPKFMVKEGLFANQAEVLAFRMGQDMPTRTEQVDFNGFTQGDARLVIFNTNHRTRNIHITRVMLEDAKRLLGTEGVVYASQDNLVKTCRDNPGAILLCIDGQRMNLALISRARRHAAATVLWTFDDPYNLNSHLAAESHFDLIFTNDSGAAAAYGEKGFFLPLGAAATSAEEDEHEKDYDIFFCGTAWPNRVVLLNRLLADRPEYRYKLALTYNPHVPAVPLDRSRSSYVKTLSYDDYMAYASRSEITLALHRNFSGTDKLATSSSPGPRMFEVAAAGSFQVSEDVGVDFKRIFNEDTVDYFADYDSLLKSIDGALKDSDSTHRSKARALRRKVAARHTYAHRLNAILTEVRRLSSPEPVQAAAVPATRPKVLYVVHNTVQAEGYGGLEIHQDTIKENLCGEYDFYFFYTRISDKGRDIVFADSKYNVLKVKNTADKVLHGRLEHRAIEQFFSEVLSEYDFDGVHFFHFMNSVPSLAHIVRAANVPYVASIHDFYTACRQFNLTSYKGAYCDNKHTLIDDCDVCLRRQYSFPAGSQMERRDYFLEVLDNAASVIFVSDHTRDKFKDIYPQLDYETKARIHGAPIPNKSWAFRRMARAKQERQKGENPKVLVLGNFHPNKGGDYFIDAISAFSKLDLDFHFHGGADERVKKSVVSILGKKCTFHGKYRPGEIDLTQYDFSLHISNWPETYCQTLSEAWAARLVPIVTDIGALGTRVTHGVNGLKTDPNRPATLSRMLREISDDPEKFLALRENITDDLFLSQDDQASLYRQTYGELFGPQIALPKDKEISSGKFTLIDLQRDRRRAFWNERQVKHPADKITLPSMEYLAEAERIKGCDGPIHCAQSGNIDFIKVGGAKAEPSYEIVVKNDQIVTVQGWVAQPAEAMEPIALVVKSGGLTDPLVFDAMAYDRKDLIDYFNDKSAKSWGLRINFRMLNIKHFLSDSLDLYIGWRSPATGAIYTNKVPKKINMRYGG